jgi:uncharacterized protein YndB with AHSA1/START domain
MWGSQVTGSIEIDRPVEEVFDLVADERNEPLYNLDMISSEKLTDGPIGVGTRFGATNRSFGRPVSMVIEVTAFERPHRLASTTRMEGMVLDGGLTFDPTGRGTRMSWSWSLHPTGPMRLLTPLLAMVGRRNERRIWTGLKHHPESRNHRDHHRAPG